VIDISSYHHNALDYGGTKSSYCSGDDRKRKGVLEGKPEMKKIERATVMIMIIETVPMNVILWHLAGIAFSCSLLRVGSRVSVGNNTG